MYVIDSIRRHCMNNSIRVNNTFQCPECSLMYVEGDIITAREMGTTLIHDCDNCLAAIQLDRKGDIVTQ